MAITKLAAIRISVVFERSAPHKFRVGGQVSNLQSLTEYSLSRQTAQKHPK